MLRKEKTNFESPERLNRLVDGSKIIGDLIADSNLRIDGEVRGNVSTSAKVVVGENGKITGNLTCLNADIEGVVLGNLVVEELLVLRNNARIQGDIQTARIQIEEGANFNGRCQMGAVSNADQISVKDLNEDSSIVY